MNMLTDASRSKNMAAIKGKNTKPEMVIRRFLHAEGFRFRLHRKDLPGSPDLVLPRYNLAVFVHGCFWHRHKGCHYASFPKTRVDFWDKKFSSNIHRDMKAQQDLLNKGWRVLVIWECGLKHCSNVVDEIVRSVQSTASFGEWPSTPPRARDI